MIRVKRIYFQTARKKRIGKTKNEEESGRRREL